MRNIRFAAALFVGLLPSVALAQDVDWSTAFRFRTTGGFQNPLSLVAFNPQPEPPAYFVPPEIDLSESTQLRMTIPDIAVSEGGAQILIALPEGFSFESEGEPIGESFFFQAIGPSPLDVQFTMTTGSGGTAAPGSWVSFNPQPEPPAGWIGMGFEFQFTSKSPATLVVEITDDGAEPLSFELLQGADFDADGDVDKLDLGDWASSFGTKDGGDANLDGIANGEDFVLWQRQYTGPAGTATVPEPAAWGLALVGFLAVADWRHFAGVQCRAGHPVAD